MKDPLTRWAPVVLIGMSAGSLACGGGDTAGPGDGSAAPTTETVAEVASESPVASTTEAPTTVAPTTVAPTTSAPPTTVAATVAPTTPAPTTAPATIGVEPFERCLELNRPLIEALDQLHLQLDGGIAFGDYTVGMQTVSAATEQALLPPELWETDCRYDVNDPLAQAWKIHLATWGEWDRCLADDACSTDDIDAGASWDEAEELLLGAIDSLAAMAPDGWEPGS